MSATVSVVSSGRTPKRASWGCLRCLTTWIGDPVCWICGADLAQASGRKRGTIVPAWACEVEVIPHGGRTG